MSHYPNLPGWRSGPNSETSREAARRATPSAGPLKERVRAAIAISPATPEELVAHFAERGERLLLNTIRARCSTDLHKLGELTPSGTFGKGEGGKTRVIRWRMTTPAERADFAARTSGAM